MTELGAGWARITCSLYVRGQWLPSSHPNFPDSAEEKNPTCNLNAFCYLLLREQLPLPALYH